MEIRSERSGEGIGSALILEGLSRLVGLNAQGCVVLGDPGYYGRFGFVSDPGLRFGGAESRYFERLAFTDYVPKGDVAFHPGFGVGCPRAVDGRSALL